jgi:FKBP-type peptidyl-prolyl cis-trans isomerase
MPFEFQVSVHYIGKLKNGKIFDSNVGRAPFKFRLGTMIWTSQWITKT